MQNFTLKFFFQNNLFKFKSVGDTTSIQNNYSYLNFASSIHIKKITCVILPIFLILLFCSLHSL